MNNLCICWLFTHIFTARRLYKSFCVRGLILIIKYKHFWSGPYRARLRIENSIHLLNQSTWKNRPLGWPISLRRSRMEWKEQGMRLWSGIAWHSITMIWWFLKYLRLHKTHTHTHTQTFLQTLTHTQFIFKMLLVLYDSVINYTTNVHAS
jgi:hypothetical protein